MFLPLSALAMAGLILGRCPVTAQKVMGIDRAKPLTIPSFNKNDGMYLGEAVIRKQGFV